MPAARNPPGGVAPQPPMIIRVVNGSLWRYILGVSATREDLSLCSGCVSVACADCAGVSAGVISSPSLVSSCFGASSAVVLR